jgi:hypothetical protein
VQWCTRATVSAKANQHQDRGELQTTAPEYDTLGNLLLNIENNKIIFFFL